MTALHTDHVRTHILIRTYMYACSYTHARARMRLCTHIHVHGTKQQHPRRCHVAVQAGCLTTHCRFCSTHMTHSRCSTCTNYHSVPGSVSLMRCVWHVCDMFVACLWHVCGMCAAWLFRNSFVCDMAFSWLMRVQNMTHSCAWHDSFMCVTWLIHVRDCVTYLIHAPVALNSFA